jgi:CRP/FNR family transcriptional regulator
MSALATPVIRTQQELEDPLAHLPHSKIIEYRKGEVVYDQNNGPAGLYLVISGRVKVAQPVENARDVIIDIYRADEFFGEASILGRSSANECAITIERVRLMMWPAEVLVEIMNTRPKLPIALLQASVQRTLNLCQRIRNLHAGTVECRVAEALRSFAERAGTPRPDGSVRLAPLTHELLAQYVGTSREAITLYMTRLRSRGFVNYSRQEMVVHLSALKDWLRQAADQTS